jgi:hypothetical protein
MASKTLIDLFEMVEPGYNKDEGERARTVEAFFFDEPVKSVSRIK